MNKVLHRADTRGLADHGWLRSRHTFSFAGYHDPARMGFGKLRVINDDVVAGGGGFATHPHDNMEIVSIPLHGGLRHRDSMGNTHVIRAGEVQVMSAGTGLTHSEYNDSATEAVNFLQIWVLPDKRNIAPRYGQKAFDPAARRDRFQLVVAPDIDDQAIWINQNAWFSLADPSAQSVIRYDTHGPAQGIYLFVIDGDVEVAGERLARRDGLGVAGERGIELHAMTDARLLAIEVPFA